MDESVNGGFCIAPSCSLACEGERDGEWPQSGLGFSSGVASSPTIYCYSNSSQFYISGAPLGAWVFTLEK